MNAPRRRRADPIVVVAVVLLLIAAGAVFVVSRSGADHVEVIDAAAQRALPQPLVAPTPTRPEIDVKALEQKSAKTAKGKLMKDALKKRAEQKVASAGSPGMPGTPGSSGGTLDVVLSGDGALKRAFASKLKSERVVDGSEHGFALSLKTQSGHDGDGVWVRCSAAVSELPQKKLVASLSDRADVQGDGSAGDLTQDAADACISSLAEDVGAWMRAHR